MAGFNIKNIGFSNKYQTVEAVPPVSATRGVCMGGAPSGYTPSNIMEYITIATLGNAIDFGDLTVARRATNSGVHSSTRGCMGGGYTGANSNVIDYITIATTGNATDFGDLLSARYGLSGCNSDVRGVFFGGSGDVTAIEYITIASTGNATDFGDLLTTLGHYQTALNSDVRGISFLPDVVSIDYITIATTGNSTDFGNLSFGKSTVGMGISNLTRGVIALGISTGDVAVNVIEYITIATTGNATDFGDLTVTRMGGTGVNSGTRGVFMGGDNGTTWYDTIDYITVATTGNATDFGDLTSSRGAAMSGVNDGL